MAFSQFLSPTTQISNTMLNDEASPWSHQLMGESISYVFPTFSDHDDTNDFSGDSWWANPMDLEQELIYGSPNSFTTTTNTSTTPTPTDSIISQPLDDYPKKRKIPSDDSNAKTPQKKDLGSRKPATNKKRNKSDHNNSGNNKEVRWAEQLLNPCAAAITSRNPSRVQHFLYVLHELSSLNGDANHRLAFYGLKALTYHLQRCDFSSSTDFASRNSKFFRDSLIKFNDINPWFRIPNNVANTSIIQILGEQKKNLHILDIGVSHGVQWPTLLEELTRRSGGPPPLVRLTVVDQPRDITVPFANSPSEYDFTSKLLSFAKDMNINLQISKLDNFHMQNLNSQVINSSVEEETLVICAQFRLHNLDHSTVDDERKEFLRVLRSLKPEGVILSENDTDCSCNSCGDFTTGFTKKVEYLWKFLDSASCAHKGRECDERRMMEAEAAKVLINGGEMNERKERWFERMVSAGFKGQLFGEDTVDGAKALLRKYDSNWEIRVEEKNSCIRVCWKGQPVSFCSLWKMDSKVKE